MKIILSSICLTILILGIGYIFITIKNLIEYWEKHKKDN